MLTRRAALAAASAAALASPAAAAETRRKAPPGFLWGAAISAYQSEGNNTNTDTWLMENVTPTIYKDRSGDSIDSYHRFAEDIALNAALGFNAYRFGIEWARIEPSEGHFSNAELDHYEQVLKTCRAHGQTTIVTFNHFSSPLWFSKRGGWERDDAPDLFARYCGKVTERLGHLMDMATPFNEANIQRLLKIWVPGLRAATQPMIDAARKACGSERFTSLTFADPDASEHLLIAGHQKAYAAMKAAAPHLKVGMSLTTQAVEPVGEHSIAPKIEHDLYGPWLDAARDYSDFTGVQPYSRFRFDDKGMVPPPPGAELTAAGYEFYPKAVSAVIRWAHREIPGKPIYVTENGIGTDDDARRIAFVDLALAQVRACLEEGIPVHSYLYWSLLDNFEWTSGYSKHFGLVAVDLQTFKRTPKPSAIWLGKRAKSNLI
ncbi:MAG TPA: family 1 glycosylhydrolase [Caulobacteraceae bacterium]|jgi:beta-glucosidase